MSTQTAGFTSRGALEENSPSRRNGIDQRQEASYRWSYCEFLKDAGVMLKMPQLTIATAAVFCHRFYARHSHGAPNNEWFTIATACLFLAGKVEETPKPLKEVVQVSYLIQHKQTLRSGLEHEQREKILRAEMTVLQTLGYDFNVEHPYKHLLNLVGRCRLTTSKPELNWRLVSAISA